MGQRTVSNDSGGTENIRQVDGGTSKRSQSDKRNFTRPAGDERLGGTGGDSGNVRLNESQRNKLNKNGVVDTHLESADYAVFSKALDEGKAANKFGGYVDPISPEKLKEEKAVALLSDDASVGVAIKKDGDICGAFNSGAK